MADNIAQVFAAAVAADPTKPLLTWYDDVSGERTELSGATLANWVAKTGNLLVDAAIGPSDPVGVLLPPHWQTAAVLVGCWSTGAVVARNTPQPVEVVFAAIDRVTEAVRWPAGERYVLGLAPLAAPLRQVPSGFADYVVEVRGHADHFSPYQQGSRQDVELLAQATRRGAELGIRTGSRVLIDVDRHPDPIEWLLTPLVSRASMVLCANLDRDRLADRLAAERVDISLT